jgi:hypothetical protein
LRGHEVLRSRLAVLIALVVRPMLLVACASGGAQAQDKAPRRCARSSRRCSPTGPDPGADPVGDAMSQILPLGRISTSDRSVARAVGELIAGDRALVDSDGGARSATQAITKADDALNGACPGVAP